jgi:two-component system chemotaxis response regulator CheV
MADVLGTSAHLHLEDSAGILEMMEFTISGEHYGINVAKVTEIMQRKPLTPVPRTHPFIDGIFEPRGQIVTVINLAKYLELPEHEPSERDIFMITNFSNMNAAFYVHSVVDMHRIRWSEVTKPDLTIYESEESVVMGNTQIEDRLITIIDFEKVLYDINPDTGIQISEIDDLGERDRSAKPIVLAEDSVFLKKMIMEAMGKAGYSNVRSFINGFDAWDYLVSVRKNCTANNIPIESMVAALITDIEMPRMDGHQLTKLVKGDATLSKVPVIVFSSLIDEAQRAKGDALGVAAHLSKPQIGNLVSTLDQWIL